MDDERRRHVRKRVDLHAVFQTGDGPPRPVHVADLCPGGALLECPNPAAFGSQIELTVTLPAGKQVKAKATVRWVRGNGMGVQFGALGASHTYALTEYLANVEK